MFLILPVGCGAKGPKRAPVVGTVTLAGKPVVGASVSFVPRQPAARSASATTDAEGKYRLVTLGLGDGALVGPHRVCIALRGEPVAAGAPKDANYLRDIALRPVGKALIPERYFDPETSGLTADVANVRENRFDYELQP